jgi:hypothetical protein
MTTLLEAGSVLKSDTRNRVRTAPDRREALLDEFERGGMSGARFAALMGIKYQTFANWVAKRRRQRQAAARAEGEVLPVSAAAPGGGGGNAVRWLEAVVGREAGCSRMLVAKGGLRVHLPGGAYLEVTDRAQLMLAAELVRVLATSSTL